MLNIVTAVTRINTVAVVFVTQETIVLLPSGARPKRGKEAVSSPSQPLRSRRQCASRSSQWATRTSAR